ncbi:MAG: retroviral-like aspartic protease family protein [Phycisphaerales bacterium]
MRRNYIERATATLGVLAMLAIFASCSAPMRATPVVSELVAPGDPARVPLRRAHAVPCVEARINGSLGLFAIDTGSEFSAISPAFADTLGLVPKESSQRIYDAHGERVDLRVATLSDIRLGAAHFTSLNVIVTELPESMQVDGFLGRRLFDYVALTIDGPRDLVVIDQSPPEGLGDDATTLSIVPNKRREILVPALVAGRDLSLIVDTGSAADLCLTSDDALGLPFEPDAESVDSSALGSTKQLRYARLAGELRIGGVTIDHPRVLIGTTQSIVGGRLWREAVVTIDGPSRRVRIAAG